MNLSAAKLVCKEIGINEDAFNEAIISFKGAAKRLEVLFSKNNTSVFKDFAHSPSKVKATVEAVKSQFEERKLVACIELHTFSSLNKNFLLQYADTMIQADNPIVYIDEKTFQQKKIKPYTSLDVQTAFKNDRLTFFDNADTLEQYLRGLNFQNTNLLMMSSGNFGGMDLVKLARELNI